MLEVPIFSNGIIPKVNIIAWLEFELTHYDVADHHISQNTMGTPNKEIKTV